MVKSNKACAVALALASITVLSAGEGADRVIKQSAKAAKQAAKALGKQDVAGAIVLAEQAVSLDPRRAAYRMLLGQSYLQGGRFTSAGEAFADTLQLDAGNGRAALNLALTQIARGDWQTAQRTLERHADVIPAGDRGLAMALAGDTAGAVALLTNVARSPEASPKVRQNLALAYALGGQWGVARVIATADMSPAEVDARITQWAAFAQPTAASDQVASLLGVRPVADGGQPAALALNGRVSDAPVAVAKVDPTPAPAAVQVAAVAPVVVAEVAPVKTGITFGPAREVAQPLPTPIIAREAIAFKTPLRTVAARPAKAAPGRATANPVAFASGGWHVQLGAFDNAGVARDAWSRATRRYAAFKGLTPQGGAFRNAKAAFYRLSVGGLSRSAADDACRAYRARGGDCFVRMGAGDQVASWARGNVQLAMR